MRYKSFEELKQKSKIYKMLLKEPSIVLFNQWFQPIFNTLKTIFAITCVLCLLMLWFKYFMSIMEILTKW
jgi:hypothetical protein